MMIAFISMRNIVQRLQDAVNTSSSNLLQASVVLGLTRAIPCDAKTTCIKPCAWQTRSNAYRQPPSSLGTVSMNQRRALGPLESSPCIKTEFPSVYMPFFPSGPRWRKTTSTTFHPLRWKLMIPMQRQLDTMTRMSSEGRRIIRYVLCAGRIKCLV